MPNRPEKPTSEPMGRSPYTDGTNSKGLWLAVLALLITVLAPGAPALAENAHIVSTLATFESGTGGLTVAPDGTLYHSDFGSKLGGPSKGGNRVFKITPQGEVSVFATSLRGASGSEWGQDGWLYQSNIGGNTVSRIDPKGKVETFSSGGLFNPVGIVQEPSHDGQSGDFLVANCGSGSIQRISPSGESTLWVKNSLLACPNGIVVDEQANVYTSNFMNGNVVEITPDGNTSVLATLPGNNNGHLFFHHNALWVVARSAHQIYRVDLDDENRGTVTLIAGSGEKGGKDGPALEATFCYPNDLGFSPDGTVLYINEVADTASTGQLLTPSRIRTIKLLGGSHE